jgi:hypothetical protein
MDLIEKRKELALKANIRYHENPENAREYYQKNKGKIIARVKKWQAEHKDRDGKTKKQRYERYKAENRCLICGENKGDSSSKNLCSLCLEKSSKATKSCQSMRRENFERMNVCHECGDTLAKNSNYYCEKCKEINRIKGLEFVHSPEGKLYKKIYHQSIKFISLQMISGQIIPQCSRCGINDIRILTINHDNGKNGLDKALMTGRKPRYTAIYKHIFSGKRKTDDLSIMCYNCNMLYDYETGKRKGIQETRQKALNLLSNGKIPRCIKCGEVDERILNINHINGLNGERRKSVATIYREITEGKGENLDIRCYNCNILHEYEGRKRVGIDMALLENYLKKKNIINQTDSIIGGGKIGIEERGYQRERSVWNRGSPCENQHGAFESHRRQTSDGD